MGIFTPNSLEFVVANVDVRVSVHITIAHGYNASSWTSSKKSGVRQMEVMSKSKMSVLASLQITVPFGYGVKGFRNSGAQHGARTLSF